MCYPTSAVKLMRSPKSDSGRSRSWRFSFNNFYFATGDAKKYSGLEIEFMLYTGASCLIIFYRIFWEISQFQHPIVVHRSNKLTKTYSGQVVPMIGYATTEFSYDPFGDYSFPLTVLITEMKTQNLLGLDFCQNQASEIYFDVTGIELTQPPKTFCYGSLHQNKTFPYLSRILTVRLPYTMHVDTKSTRCWKYSPGDPKSLFPPGSPFQPNREAMSTGRISVNLICTQLEPTLPILIENNKNHQITLPKGRIGFSSLNVIDKEEPKYQIRNPDELANAIVTTGRKYNDCFLLHWTVPAQSKDDCPQIFHGTKDSKLKQPHSIGHCISVNAKRSRRFADLLSQRILGLRDAWRWTKLLTVLTEIVSDWKKLISSGPKSQSTTLFFESLHFNPPTKNRKSVNQYFQWKILDVRAESQL